MTGPHVYGANSPQPSPYQTPYTGYYTTPQHSPFIPPVDIIGNHPPSPYRGSSPLPPTIELQPNTVNAVPFPGSYDAGGYPLYPYQRPRAPSYHGPPPGSPFVPPVAPYSTPPWPRQHKLSNPSYPGVIPGVAFPASSPWTGLATPLPGTFGEQVGAPIALHPFLDGESAQSNFMFNLASQVYAPMQYLPTGVQVPVGPNDMSQPATHPPVYRLTIVIDQLPDWPITLEYDPEQFRQQTGASLPYPPPITVGDVLSQIHKKLHERISHNDWVKLDDRRRYKITQAYTARCASAPTMEHLMRSDGVKKVDYLLDKTWFRGLVRTSDSTPEMLKLVVSRRPN